jgi:hypothetical protein
MTTFKEIRGQLIRSVSSDPANPQVGEIWYNSYYWFFERISNIDDAWAEVEILEQLDITIGGAGTQTAVRLWWQTTL